MKIIDEENRKAENGETKPDKTSSNEEKTVPTAENADK